MNADDLYRRWRERADASLRAELDAMDAQAREDAFYRDLAFGTGGLRGVIGAGTNRMNLHTVRRASQGLSDYMVKNYLPALRRVAIGYDSRILSEEFAHAAAGVFAANGIQVLIYPELMPTPCLSFAVRALRCAAGVMVTASHNPAQYNGYKVYGPDGCQITSTAAAEIQAAIDRLDMFDDVRELPFEDGLVSGRIGWIQPRTITAFIDAVKSRSLLGREPVDRSAAIVYTPLNGTGLKPVLRALGESGFTNVSVVEAQAKPDGRFPTCPYPNPEVPEAMRLGLERAEQLNADLLLATDPDCDRCGIAVRRPEGGYALLTGNQTGVLLLDYICQRRAAMGAMPRRPVLVKTIVTTGMAERVAAKYGVETINVLTGFKYIGETIGRLELQGEAERYIFGFEESCGYLSGTHVRDKDAVDAALMICEMFAWHRARGVGLLERLEALYREFGYCLDTQHSYAFEGPAGFGRMQAIMRALRGGIDRLGSRRVARLTDYAAGVGGLPPSDVLKFELTGGASAVVRPSGTEPKLKVYLSVPAPDRAAAAEAEAALAKAVEAHIRS